MAEVTELVTRFSFQGSSSPLSDYAGKLGIATVGLAAFTTAITAALAAVQSWTTGVTKSIDPVIQLSRNTRIAIGDIQALGYAASVSGSSADAMYASIDALSEKIGEAAQKGSEDFSRLGISVRDMNGHVKDAPQIMNELTAAFNRMNLSMPERRRFAGALGIDPTLVQLLSKTSSEIGALTSRAKELGVLTKEQADAAADYNDSITTLQFGLDALRQQIAVAIAPEFRQMVEEITDLIIANKEWIKEGIAAVVGALTEMMKSVRRMLPVLAVLGGAFFAMKIYTLGWAGALGILFSPIVLMTAGIAALWLIVDDLIVAFSGGRSVINEFFKEFLGVDLTDITKMLSEMFFAVDRLIRGDFAGAWDSFMKAAQMAYDFTKNLFSNLFKKITPSWFDDIKNSIPESTREILGKTTFGLVGDAARMFGIGQQQPVVTNGGDVNINQTNTFDVKTSDPQAAAKEINDVLQRQLQNNNAQLGQDSVGVRGGQ